MPESVKTPSSTNRSSSKVKKSQSRRATNTPQRTKSLKNAPSEKHHSQTPPQLTVQRPPSTLILIWLLVLAELVMDFVTTVISFLSALSDFECCGLSIDFRGSLVLAVTIPFFLLILVELGVLGISIRQGFFGNLSESSNDIGGTEGSFAFLGTTAKQRWINGLLLLNPFLGFLMAWMLLYQSNRRECLTVLGLEAASLVLHYITIYLEGQKQTRLSIFIYSLPLIPFAVTVIVIMVYLRRGGVCYLADQEIFWYEGCQICSGQMLPDDETGQCADGSETFYGDHCSDAVSFCWFEYA